MAAGPKDLSQQRKKLELRGISIGHFRIAFGLFFEASPGAHLFI